MLRFRVLAALLVATLGISLGAGPAAAKKTGKAKGSKVSGQSTKKAAKRAFPVYDKAFQKKHRTGPKSDPDGDGLNSYNEFLAGTNPRKTDSDGDGVLDGSEDPDRDGLHNLTEQEIHTNPSLRDTKRNGRPDGREDRDKDGLSNLNEQRTGLDPRDPDTDDDGVKDGKELAGRIVSFDENSGDIRLWVAGRNKTVDASVGADISILCGAAESEEATEPDDEDFSDEPAPEDLELSVEASSSGAGDDDSFTDDGAFEDEAGFDDEAGLEDEDQGGCSESLRKGLWFSNAELTDNDGFVTLDLIELVSR